LLPSILPLFTALFANPTVDKYTALISVLQGKVTGFIPHLFSLHTVCWKYHNRKPNLLSFYITATPHTKIRFARLFTRLPKRLLINSSALANPVFRQLESLLLIRACLFQCTPLSRKRCWPCDSRPALTGPDYRSPRLPFRHLTRQQRRIHIFPSETS